MKWSRDVSVDKIVEKELIEKTDVKLMWGMPAIPALGKLRQED
jgi:hypothetical protein